MRHYHIKKFKLHISKELTKINKNIFNYNCILFQSLNYKYAAIVISQYNLSYKYICFNVLRVYVNNI